MVSESQPCACRLLSWPTLVCCPCVWLHTLFFLRRGTLRSHVCCGRRTALACPKGVTTADPTRALPPRLGVTSQGPEPSLSPETLGTCRSHRTDVCQSSACVPSLAGALKCLIFAVGTPGPVGMPSSLDPVVAPSRAVGSQKFLFSGAGLLL